MEQLTAFFRSILTIGTTRRADAERNAWVAEVAPKSKTKVRRGRTKLKLKEVSWIVSQLATTQAAGIPLYRALGMIAKMRAGSPVGTKAALLQEATSEGATLSQAIAEHMPESGTLIAALVSAGESSGALEEALRRAVTLTEGRQRLIRKLRAALTYPIMVVIVCAGLVTALLTVVVPKFKDIYGSVGAELPALTKAVMALSDRLPIVAVLVVAVVVALVTLIRRAASNPSLAVGIDKAKMRIPVIGPLIRKAAVARAVQTLASLVGSGVSLLDALALAARTAGSVQYENALSETRDRIGDGSTLAAALAETGQFPELMVQLVAVGEESGSLAQVLEHYAKQSAEELETSAEAVTSLVEPLLMVFIGLVIAVFVVALYLPVISLGQKLSG